MLLCCFIVQLLFSLLGWFGCSLTVCLVVVYTLHAGFCLCWDWCLVLCLLFVLLVRRVVLLIAVSVFDVVLILWYGCIAGLLLVDFLFGLFKFAISLFEVGVLIYISCFVVVAFVGIFAWVY